MKPATSFPEILGRAVKIHRENKSLNQSAVAEALGMTQSGYSRLERGDVVISVAQLRKLGSVFGVASSELVRQAEQVEAQLRAQGVEVFEERPDEAGSKWLWVAFSAIAAIAVAVVIGNSDEQAEVDDG